jgi:mannose/cellobiose epimerase-like protein (N-acyl-D-glucosamine 2-epimerase family)
VSEPLLTLTDLVAGYVLAVDGDRVRLRTIGDATVTLTLGDAAWAHYVRNLGEPYAPAPLSALRPGQFIFAHGPAYVDGGGVRYHPVELSIIDESGERPGWWRDQLAALARFYRRSQFGSGAVDFANYRTGLDLAGHHYEDRWQETDTLSRMVYGMASAYLLTGDEDFLDVAERGARYQQDTMRVVDADAEVTWWVHALDGHQPYLASEFDDDRGSMPAYEQIYALVGLVQTFRVTGDPSLRADIEGTVRLFERFFADPARGGFYSHVEITRTRPLTLDPHAQRLERNRSRKNWNSIGDHAPAYLFNLYLATGEARYLDLLEHTFDLIATHFPDPTGNPLVRERFDADWNPDLTWGWQLDRGVVGHNLKIAWNLTRMNALRPKAAYRDLAARLAAQLPAVGRDPHRGGWYDVLHRGNPRARFVWHDRKVWWQQEQAILAYFVLAGHHGAIGPEGTPYLRHAREAAAFYNTFFLDQEDGGVYFAVEADGIPYLRNGSERRKGSHSMSMYHASELCYLATVYSELLVQGRPLELHFRPQPPADRLLRVTPDALPRGRFTLGAVTIDDQPYDEFDPTTMTIQLPRTRQHLRVRATICPL